MLIQIPNLLTKDQVKEFRQVLDKAAWVDGKETAGGQAARVKNNLQLKKDSQEAKDLGKKIIVALEKHPLFISAVLPLKILPPAFNKYTNGGEYGTHVDNAIRQIPGTPVRIRTDISVTLFLSEPDEYEGGELVIEDTYGTHSAKLTAGSAIAYPSTSLHHVNAVKKGTRVASFFWVQSMIREDSQRALLFELDNAARILSKDYPKGNPALVQLTGVYHNLLRRWANI